ncbi:MAG: DUF3127 domain-containing protein [Bacteroidales bacterium]|nr:DUF3127 domain-containing protein [Bacteroidales bacterium]
MFKVKGTIKNKFAKKHGISNSNGKHWVSQEFLLRSIVSNKTNDFLFRCNNADTCMDLDQLDVDSEVMVEFTPESVRHKGLYYTNLIVLKIRPSYMIEQKAE